jgi:prepilin-type processing-associated H-X9-DG protein/prepilin-type N-terminal cleavage/methylation domain-containing protein
MKRHCFTLIELLVVIAIMALLMSILLPSLNRARAMGRKTACMSNMREMGRGLYFYAQDYHEFFPVTHGSLDYLADDAEIQEWWKFLPVYGFRREYMLCPDDPHRDELAALDDPCSGGLVSYAVNGFFEFGRQLSKVVYPADKICVSERGDQRNEEGVLEACYHPWKVLSLWDWLLKHDRHLGRSNYLFADLHVEWLKWEETIGDANMAQDPDVPGNRHYLPEFNPPYPPPWQ